MPNTATNGTASNQNGLKKTSRPTTLNSSNQSHTLSRTFAFTLFSVLRNIKLVATFRMSLLIGMCVCVCVLVFYV